MDVLDELKREGREEGRRVGRVEGRVEGVARTLLGQLAARFGAVPAEAKARILAATEPTLARWSLQVLTAPTLEAVLGGGKVAKKVAKKPASARQSVSASTPARKSARKSARKPGKPAISAR